MNNNVLEFFVKMKDLMSGGLVKIAQNSKKAFGTVTSNIDEVIQKNKKLSSSFNDVDSNIKKTGSSLGGFARQLGIAVSLAGAFSFASGSVKAAMNFGATKTSFGVLTGSKQKGNDLANSLNTLQQNTILGPEVFKAAQTMMAFGIASEKVVDIQKQLGDISMGNSEKFDSLTLAYSQTQAAGRLMGQDLLQYINAGFNPLQTMSEKWKEFGFQQKQSVGQLKELMEKGKISSEMVAKAFELATATGGKFANMMNEIAETSYGKMQILSGQWKNLKIQAGNALMPVAESAMEAAKRVMNWLNISKTIPEVLVGEKLEINSIVASITKLNEGNTVRSQMMDTLKNKYPDLFGNIDKEKTKNSELLQILKDINGQYNNKISLASQQLISETAGNDIKDKLAFATRISAQDSYNNTAGKQGIVESFFPKYMSIFDKYKLELGEYSDVYKKGGVPAVVNSIQKQVQDLQQTKSGAEQTKSTMENAQLLAEISKGISNKGLLKSKFGGKKGITDFLNLFNSVYSKSMNGSATMSDYSNLGGLWAGVSAKDINGGGSSSNSSNTKAGRDSIAGGVTSGGPRVINITIGKMVEKIELNTTTVNEGLDKIEEKVQEVFLRVLNSGATMQSN